MDSWMDRDWLAYDLETTSLDVEEAHVVQVGMARMRGAKILGRMDKLVRPPSSIPAESTAVHGITDRAVADAMPELAALDAMLDALRSWDGPLVTYNGLGYDDQVLDARTGGAFAAAVAGKARLDVMVLLKLDGVGAYWKGKGRHKLSSVAGRLGVGLDDDDRLHWASSDCVLTCRVLARLCDDPQWSGVLRRLPQGPEVTTALLEAAAGQKREFEKWLAKQPKWEEARS